MRCIHGTMYYGLRYVANKDAQLRGYTYAIWARSDKDRKKNQGYSLVWAP